jgi:nucleoside 2-deoxyribosyltransferase
MPKVYLASPLGFSTEYRSYLERIKARLTQLGFEIFNPWEQPFSREIREASGIADHDERLAAFTRLAKEIGAANEDGIRDSDILLAVLDGAEVDSGCAAEVGVAVGLGKPTYALRTDWRDSGEFGLPVNLQILHFIETSGGSYLGASRRSSFDLNPLSRQNRPYYVPAKYSFREFPKPLPGRKLPRRLPNND